MAATDVERLRRALADVDFPAEKTDLVRSADQAGADDDTVRALKSVPPVTYSSFNELLRAVPLALAFHLGRAIDRRVGRRRCS